MSTPEDSPPQERPPQEEPSMEIEIDSDRREEAESPPTPSDANPAPKNRSALRTFIHRALWLTGIGLLLGLTLVGLALWQADRVVNRFVPEIQAWLTSAAGTEVAIGRVETGWRAFRPEVRLIDIRVGKPGATGEPSATAARLELELDLSQSLVGLTPRFRRLATHSIHVAAAATASRPTGRILATELAQTLGAHLATGFTWVATDFEWNEPQRFKLKFESAKAQLRLTADSWEGDLEITKASIDAPAFWLRPLIIDELETPLRLQGLTATPPKLIVALDPALAKTPGVELGFGLRAEWPNELDRLPRLDLQLDSGAASLATIRGLLPAALFGHDLKLWIDTAVQQGQTTGVSLRLSGPSQDWAERGVAAFKDPAVSKLEVEMPFHQAAVDYYDGWPKLEQASGKLVYRQTDLAVDVTEGSSVHGKFRDGHVILGSLHEPKLTLRVTGEWEATPDQMKAFMTEGLLSGLKDGLQYGEPHQPWRTRFEATVPLEKGDWKADLDIAAGGFTLKKPATALTNVTGHATVSPTRLSFQGGKAQWGDRILEWSLQSNAHSNAKKRETRVAVSGALEAARIREIFPALALPPFVEGGSLWKIEATAQHEEGTRITVEGNSTLVGSKLDLPAPLAKDAAEEWPLSFRTQWLNGELQSARGYFSGAGNEAELEYHPPLVKAQIKTRALDLTPWIEWSEKLPPAPAAAPDEPPATPWMGVVRLTAPEVKWKNHRFARADVQLDAAEKLHTVTLKSQGLNGKVEVSRPWKQGKVKLDLTELKLAEWPFAWPPRPGDAPADETAATTAEDLDPPLPPAWDMRDWPSIVLKADGFHIAEEPLGELRFKLSRAAAEDGKPTVFTLDFARWSAGPFELFTKSGRVELGATPGEGKTSLEVELKLKKFNRPTPFLKSAQSLSVSEGHAKFTGSWPGTPNQFRLKSTTGEANAYLATGKLTGVKLFVQTLFNTLSLNFEDSRKQIMRFSKMTFDAAFQPGRVQVREARALFGTVFAKLEGTVTTPERGLQLEALLTPAVADIEEDDVGFTPESHDSNEARRMAPKTLFTHRYSVGGTWEKPQISLKGL